MAGQEGRRGQYDSHAFVELHADAIAQPAGVARSDKSAGVGGSPRAAE
jgi:hypothetical protein